MKKRKKNESKKKKKERDLKEVSILKFFKII